MQYTIEHENPDISITIKVVDEIKFNAAMEEFNKFWCDAQYRADYLNGHVLAGLKMFAAECMQQIAFNNFKDEAWLKDQFDWNKNNKGIEGYSRFEDAGLEVTNINSWFIDIDDLEIV